MIDSACVILSMLFLFVAVVRAVKLERQGRETEKIGLTDQK